MDLEAGRCLRSKNHSKQGTTLFRYFITFCWRKIIAKKKITFVAKAIQLTHKSIPGWGKQVSCLAQHSLLEVRRGWRTQTKPSWTTSAWNTSVPTAAQGVFLHMLYMQLCTATTQAMLRYTVYTCSQPVSYRIQFSPYFQLHFEEKQCFTTFQQKKLSAIIHWHSGIAQSLFKSCIFFKYIENCKESFIQ